MRQNETSSSRWKTESEAGNDLTSVPDANSRTLILLCKIGESDLVDIRPHQSWWLSPCTLQRTFHSCTISSGWQTVCGISGADDGISYSR